MSILELDTLARRQRQGRQNKRKGAEGERKAKKRLEAQGYTVIKAGGSLGCFDLIALGPQDIRAVQVKVNGYCSKVERAAMHAAILPPNSTREIWRWLTRVREPLVETLGPVCVCGTRTAAIPCPVHGVQGLPGGAQFTAYGL